MRQIFSENLRKGWIEWEIRAMVIVNLMLQSILILIGNKRKHSTRNWLRFILWLAYLSADWVATVSLSVLPHQTLAIPWRRLLHQSKLHRKAFWAPFLLLHLSGPDTVTAYSLEDIQVWWRQFLMLLVQVGVAFHVFVQAWTSNLLNFLSVPILVVTTLESQCSLSLIQAQITPDTWRNIARRKPKDSGFR